MYARIAAAFLALAALPALATEGFFRHQESAPHESIASGVGRAGAQVCSFVIRYNTAQVSAQEITYQGPQALCIGGYDSAIRAAAGVKSTGPTDPFRDGPPYACAIIVAFDPLQPSSPSTSFVGAEACTPTRTTALAAAWQNMQCVLECRFGM